MKMQICSFLSSFDYRKSVSLGICDSNRVFNEKLTLQALISRREEQNQLFTCLTASPTKILSYFGFHARTHGGGEITTEATKGEKAMMMEKRGENDRENLSNLIIRMCTLTKGSTRRKIR
jgi:hypothetical protein